MTTERATEVLKQHNEWRRDDNIPNSKDMVNPTELGQAIDKAVEVLSELSNGLLVDSDRVLIMKEDKR